MDEQSSNGRRVPESQGAMAREVLEALWKKLEASTRRRGRDAADRVRGVRSEPCCLGDVSGDPWFDDEVGSLLAEVERLKGELRWAVRQLGHRDDGDQVSVSRPVLAALVVLARDVRAFRDARGEWLLGRAPTARPLDAVKRVWEDIELVDRVLRGRPWSSLEQLGLDALRSVAQGGAVA